MATHRKHMAALVTRPATGGRHKRLVPQRSGSDPDSLARCTGPRMPCPHCTPVTYARTVEHGAV